MAFTEFEEEKSDIYEMGKIAKVRSSAQLLVSVILLLKSGKNVNTVVEKSYIVADILF